MYSLMQNNPLFQDNATLFDINHIDEVSLQDMLPPGNPFSPTPLICQ